MKVPRNKSSVQARQGAPAASWMQFVFAILLHKGFPDILSSHSLNSKAEASELVVQEVC